MGDEDQAVDTVSPTGEIRQTYDWKSTRPSMAVVETVAATTNERPTGLDTLNDTVDADALNTLIRESDATESLRVAFEYDDARVVVYGDGTVTVRLD